jgi:hypothetical protein
MAPFVTQKKKKAARTHEQRKLSKANSDAMWADIESGRMKYIKIIESLAEKYNMYVIFCFVQLKLTQSHTKVSRLDVGSDVSRWQAPKEKPICWCF